jgi:hypothetical protein
MSSTLVAGGEKEQPVTLADVVHRLAAIEEIVWLLQPVKDPLTAIEAMLVKQGQQQQALDLTLDCVEQIVHARG